MIQDETVLRFGGLYRGRARCHGRMKIGTGGENKYAKTVQGEASEEEFREHLEGTGWGIGVVPLREDNRCYFGAVDFDDPGVDHAALAREVEAQDLPLVVCRSKSGGAHLYLYAQEPLEAPLLVSKLRNWSDALNLQNPDGRPVEIFPKQTYMAPDGDGNWINLPYRNAEKTHQVAVLGDGSELSLEEFLDHAEDLQVTEEDLVESGPFGKGPPCLQRAHALGIGSGMRNDALFNVAVFFKLASPSNWRDELRTYNREYVDPPLPEKEVETLINQHENTDYAYSAPVVWQCDCDATGCVKKEFGVTAARKSAGGATRAYGFPKLQDLRKLMTDPPIWIVGVQVGRDEAGEPVFEDIKLNTKELLYPRDFRHKAMEALSVQIPLTKNATWDAIIRELSSDVTEIDAPEDAGVRGQFILLLKEYLDRRERAASMDDLALGSPYEEDGKVWFRSSDLFKFLDQERFRGYNQSEVYQVIRELDGDWSRRRVQGTSTRVWFLPVESIGSMDLDDFAPRVAEETVF